MDNKGLEQTIEELSNSLLKYRDGIIRLQYDLQNGKDNNEIENRLASVLCSMENYTVSKVNTLLKNES